MAGVSVYCGTMEMNTLDRLLTVKSKGLESTTMLTLQAVSLAFGTKTSRKDMESIFASLAMKSYVGYGTTKI